MPMREFTTTTESSLAGFLGFDGDSGRESNSISDISFSAGADFSVCCCIFADSDFVAAESAGSKKSMSSSNPPFFCFWLDFVFSPGESSKLKSSSPIWASVSPSPADGAELSGTAELSPRLRLDSPACSGAWLF